MVAPQGEEGRAFGTYRDLNEGTISSDRSYRRGTTVVARTWRRLTNSRYVIERKPEAAVQAMVALDRVASILVQRGYRWGPGGSVGFEIATGVTTATFSSDLDLILRQDQRLEPDEAIDLQADLAEAAIPVRVDVMLETPHGGVSLADLATMPRHVLVRTPDGARLAADPWTVDPGALSESVL